jgi:hypothetical protein
MKTKLFLLMFALGTVTFSSCKRCCEGGGVKVCKSDGYSTEEWKDITEACEDTPNCSCGL